jgi:hypothetical protein
VAIGSICEQPRLGAIWVHEKAARWHKRETRDRHQRVCSRAADVNSSATNHDYLASLYIGPAHFSSLSIVISRLLGCSSLNLCVNPRVALHTERGGSSNMPINDPLGSYAQQRELWDIPDENTSEYIARIEAWRGVDPPGGHACIASTLESEAVSEKSRIFAGRPWSTISDKPLASSNARISTRLPRQSLARGAEVGLYDLTTAPPRRTTSAHLHGQCYRRVSFMQFDQLFAKQAQTLPATGCRSTSRRDVPREPQF